MEDESLDERLEKTTSKIEELKAEMEEIDLEIEGDDINIPDWKESDGTKVEKTIKDALKEKGLEEKDLTKRDEAVEGKSQGCKEQDQGSRGEDYSIPTREDEARGGNQEDGNTAERDPHST